jgi:hypothetical protein
MGNTSKSAFGRIWCESSRSTAVADSPELAAAKRLLDLAKERGFRFWRTAPGADGPVWGERESLEWLDTIFLAGFSESCNAARIRKSPLVIPGDSLVTERVSGDALEVLHTVCDWNP